MKAHYQRGALSLMWCAVLVGCLTIAAMAALLSMRIEHNLFAKAWSGLMHTQAVRELQSIQLPAGVNIKPPSDALRKCTNKGITVYSNVECRTDDASSRAVDLQDTRGFGSSNVSTLPTSKEGSPLDLQDKMIGHAIRQR